MKKIAAFDTDTYTQGKKQFTKFIKHLTQFDNKHPAPVFATKGLSESSDQVTGTRFWRIDQIEEAFDDGWKLNTNGYCISVGINEFGAEGLVSKLTTTDVSRVRAQCIDIDVPLPIDVLQNIIPILNADITTFSSAYSYEEETLAKVHLYFIYGPASKPEQETVLIENYSKLQQAIAYRIDRICENSMIGHPILAYLKETYLKKTKGHWTDKNITINKIMRVPGFWHQKNTDNATLVKCKVSNTVPFNLSSGYKSLVEKFRLTPEWFEKASKLQDADRRKITQAIAPNGKKGSPVYEETLDGNRHSEMLAYIWALVVRKNKSREEVVDIAYGANLRKNKPPLSDSQLDSMIEGAYQKLGDGFALRSNMIKIPTADRHEWRQNIKIEADTEICKYNYTNKIHENTLSDPAILSRLYDRYGDIIKGNYALGNFCYNEKNGTWEHTMSRAITKLREVIQDMRYEAYVHAQFASEDPKEEYDPIRMDSYMNSKLAIGSTRSLAQSIVTDEEFQLSTEMMNKTPYLINAPNCIIDLTNGKALPQAPDEYMTGSIAVPYHGEDAVAPFLTMENDSDWNTGINLHAPELCKEESVYVPGLWQQFLYEIMQGDIEMCCFLQRVFGYSLFGHNKEQKAFFCIGNGDNGKSLCLETIQKLFGSYTGKNISSDLLLKNTDKGSSYASSTLANLLYWRYALTGEVDNSKKWNETFFKDITTNGSITARRMKEDAITFTPKFTLFIQGNKKPEFDGRDDAIWKRVCLIPFNHKVKPQHKNVFLENMLASPAGLHEILHWTIAGAVQYSQNGLQLPSTVVAAGKAYKAEMLPFDEFFEEAIEQLPGIAAIAEVVACDMTASRIGEAYTYWCKINDREAGYITPNAVGAALDKIIKQRPVKTGSARYFPVKFTPTWQEIMTTDIIKKASVSHIGPRNQTLTLFNTKFGDKDKSL